MLEWVAVCFWYVLYLCCDCIISRTSLLQCLMWMRIHSLYPIFIISIYYSLQTDIGRKHFRFTSLCPIIHPNKNTSLIFSNHYKLMFVIRWYRKKHFIFTLLYPIIRYSEVQLYLVVWLLQGSEGECKNWRYSCMEKKCCWDTISCCILLERT